MKYRRILLGIVATPLPLVLGVLLSMSVFGERPDAILVLFASVLVSSVVWLLILISKAILHFMPWRGWGAHVTTMFGLTMVPLLLWDPVELKPDTRLSYQANEPAAQTFEFAIGGIIAMALVSFISAMCMWIFWRFFVRDRNEADPSG